MLAVKPWRPNQPSARRSRSAAPLIPAHGFYEWKRIEGAKVKQLHFIPLADDRPFAFAGLWESRRGEEDDRLESCSIVTCEPNSLMAELHDRMPVILPADLYGPGLITKSRTLRLCK